MQGSIGAVVETDIAFFVKNNGTLWGALAYLFIDKHVGAEVLWIDSHDSGFVLRGINVLKTDDHGKDEGRHVCPMKVIFLKESDPFLIEISGTEMMDSHSNT